MTYSLLDAQNAGYTLSTNGQEGTATKGGVPVLSVTSPVPLFFLLANIAEREGKGFAVGYSGTQPITPALVLAVSGETYVEPAQTPAQVAVNAALANDAAVRQRAAAALATNDAYIALAAPTTAQAVAQVKTLTRECSGLIRILIGALNDISDT